MAASRGAIEAGRAVFRLNADNDPFIRALKVSEQRLRNFSQRAGQIGQGLARAGLLISGAFALPVGIFAGFDDQMRVVQAVTNATAEDFEALTEEAKRLGRTTAFSASQVAAAMTELGRAGFSPDEILASTDAVLALARATSTELPRATEIAGAALRGFGLPAAEMGRVSDVLTAAANGSAQTLEDLFEAMKPVAPIASAAGESMEAVAAAVGVLANNGIKGSLAGNALARAYKNLSTSKTQGELKGLGVAAVDSAGNLRPLADILRDLGDATSGLPSAERLAVFETLFGRGQAAALTLANSPTAFDGLLANIERASGIAQKTAEQMDAGIGGSFRKLLSAAEGVAIAIGESLEKPIQIAANAIAAIAGVVTEWIGKNRILVASIAGAGVAILALGATLITISAAAAVVSFVIGGLVTAIGAIAAIAGVLLSPIGLLGVLAAAVVGVAAAFIDFSAIGERAAAVVGAAFAGLKATFGDTLEAITSALLSGDFETAGELLGELFGVGLDAAKVKAFAVLNELKDAALGSAIDIGTGLSLIWLETFQRIRELIADFTTFFRQAWESLAAGLSIILGSIIAKFDPTVSASQVQASISSQLAARLGELEAQRNGQQVMFEVERNLAIQQIATTRDAALDAAKSLEAGGKAAIEVLESAAAGRLGRLQKRARDLLAKQKQDPETPKPEGDPLANPGGSIADQINASQSSVRATFRASELAQASLRGVTERMATTLESIDRNIKKIEKKPTGGAFA